MNKKIVVIVVLVECVLAVLMVSLLGAAIENAHKETKASDVYFTNADYEKLRDDYVIEVDLSHGNIGYQLYYVVSPDHTTDKTVVFESSEPDAVIVSKTGYVTFVDPEIPVVIITITVADGSTRSDTITLVPKARRGSVDDF